MSNPDLVWAATLGELQLQMTQATFDTWLRDSRFLKYEDGVFVVGVKTGYAKDWLEARLLDTVTRTLSRQIGQPSEVRFVVWSDVAPNPSSRRQPLFEAAAAPRRSSRGRVHPPATLIPGYTFDSFVAGPGNRLAHAASMAVAESPATAYNPLFVYGGVGLGKTHLLNAIGHSCQARGLHVLYVSSEEFTNDLIEAIRSQKTDTFRDKYRTADILLIDDVQFMAGKESTQEEFFHTFNTLHGGGRQIVLSSDRPPNAISTLEERLRSRFEWGLIADVQPPELETRIAILRSKALAYDIFIPDELLFEIASRIQSNIRELEGALNRLVALATLTDQPLTTDLTEEALRNFVPQQRSASPDQIITLVSNHYGVEISALQGRGRSRAIARPRQIAMYLIREETGTSLPQIGALLGGRDHTTVLYGCDKITQLLDEDSELRREIMGLRQQLHKLS
jgi:chromosomal replication initiator protein